MKIPPTKKQNIVEKINNISINDQYRYLEDQENPEVKEWIKAQNEYTYSFLKNKSFEIFSNELAKNFKVVNFGNPHLKNGRYFYSERQKNEDQSVIYFKNGIDGEPIKLIDPNSKDSKNITTIDFWVVSKSGKYLVYGLSKGGTEMATLYIKNVDENKNLKEEIPNCRYSSVAWLPDDSGFFYTRNPKPGTVEKSEEHLYSKIHFHKLGENPENDELIFGKDRPKDDLLRLKTSTSGEYLTIEVSNKWTENEVHLYNYKTKEIRALITGIPANFYLNFHKEKVFLYTNHNASNGKILVTNIQDIFSPLTKWKKFIPERKYNLESISMTKSKILIEYLVNACSKVVLFDYEGKEIGELPFPKYSSLAGISSNRDEEEFFYSVNSFTFPQISYRYIPKENKYVEYRKTDNPINPDDYIVKQEWCKSKDGTKIPMFIFHKKNLSLNGKNPTILYGYGGFGTSEVPEFWRTYVPWVERGGIYVIANIRGGGEFGQNWHKKGIKENKQNSFDDFIACAKYLIKKKYTSHEHLAASGGSNGGLLVSAVAVQEPKLFAGVRSGVPLTDMVRFHKFGIASRWVNEYGSPEVKKDLKNILKWSPYHNVKKGIEYPSILFTTGINDTRVNPLHARKMTAILQSVNKKNKIFLLTEMDSGHGAGKPIKKIIETQAMILFFFAETLGLKI
ncbi:MAG: S9 family peptidase [Candidatus Pacebacteria bacterium]|nr:S9 family peptidase [Candidatus Paceibacterota bacterium]